MRSRSKVFGVLVCAVVLVCGGAAVLADDGELSAEAISKIRSGFTMDGHTRAMYNAITNTDVKNMALNRDLLLGHDEFFSKEIKVKDITSQKSSGRCWLFASLNSLRPYVIKKNELKTFEFSENYYTFWDKLEKANTFYERVIEFKDRDLMDRELVFVLRNPIPDGGYWENAKDLIQKYGAVPKGVMPETNSSNKTAAMNKVLAQKLRVDAVKLRKMNEAGKRVRQMRTAKEKMLSEVYRILVINLGEPPVEFDWRYEKKSADEDKDDDDGDEDDEEDDDEEEDKSIIIRGYTPKRFYDEFVGIDLDEYVNLFNDAPHETGKRYQIRLTRNFYDGHDADYANVELATLKEIAKKSLLDGTPVLFGADVGPDQNTDRGIMAAGLYDYGSIYNVDLSMSRAELALFRQNVPNHAMNFVGVDLQGGEPVKWRVENSWGTDRGSKGFWTMYDGWFDKNVYNVVVKREYVPEEVLKIGEQRPVVLPVWDPMW